MVGRLSEKEVYVRHAELAVRMYLSLPPPEEVVGGRLDDDSCTTEIVDEEDVIRKLSGLGMADFAEKERQLMSRKDVETEVTTAHGVQQNTNDAELLDTLPDRFQYDQKMLYSHFAHYDYDEVQRAEGKHQKAMLRQLADLFDHTGKTLFYYYTVPRLCKQSYPPTSGETVTSKAAEIWRFLAGSEKAKWLIASVRLKKVLGDRDVGGLETLQLDNLDREVLALHGLAQTGLNGSKQVSSAGK